MQKDKCNLVLKYQLPHKINFNNKENTKNLHAMTKSKLLLKLEKKVLQNFAWKMGEKTGIKE